MSKVNLSHYKGPLYGKTIRFPRDTVMKVILRGKVISHNTRTGHVQVKLKSGEICHLGDRDNFEEETK